MKNLLVVLIAIALVVFCYALSVGLWAGAFVFAAWLAGTSLPWSWAMAAGFLVVLLTGSMRAAS